MITLKETLTAIKGDLTDRNLSFGLFLTNYLYNPRFRVLLNHRLGKFFFTRSFFLVRQIGNYYKMKMVVRRNCDISYKATIGKNLKMPHPLGIVIGDHVIVKNNVTIFQQVTLGSHGKKGVEMRYPVIEDGVKIYAGATLIGGITIGENSIIGANSLVNVDVPANSIAYGIPCKIKTYI